VDGWVGFLAAELLSIGLATPIYFVEPQLNLRGNAPLEITSLKESHGKHHCDPPSGWVEEEKLTLSASLSGALINTPLVLMHVLCGYDAAASMKPTRSFNHWVPTLMAKHLSSGSDFDVENVKLFQPSFDDMPKQWSIPSVVETIDISHSLPS